MNSLILVNRQHPYTMSVRQNLTPVLPAFPRILLEREAAHALSRLMEKLGGWGNILPVSGWRSFDEQEKIYLDSLRDNGREFTRQFVALPGHSEHQTGLAIDLGLQGEDMDFIRPSFPYEGICQYFRELAPAYGFIERYPAGERGRYRHCPRALALPLCRRAPCGKHGPAGALPGGIPGMSTREKMPESSWDTHA